MGTNFNAWLSVPWILIKDEFKNHHAVFGYKINLLFIIEKCENLIPLIPRSWSRSN